MPRASTKKVSVVTALEAEVEAQEIRDAVVEAAQP